MIRIKISFGILIAIIVLGITSFFMLKKETNEIIDMIDYTKSLSMSGKTQEALEAMDNLLEEWEEFHNHASVFVNNDKIGTAQDSISRLRSLIESENDELNAEFDTAKSALKWIVESEIPRLTNIF